MKKILLALVLVALLAMPGALLAEPTIDNFQLRIPLVGIYVDAPAPCEDVVHLSGTLHVTGHVTEMENGDRLAVIHANPQAAVTQGVETGNIYHGIGVGQTVERTLGPGESYTSVNVFMQVPHGGLVYVVHMTFDADGEVTAEIDHYIQPGFTCDA